MRIVLLFLFLLAAPACGTEATTPGAMPEPTATPALPSGGYVQARRLTNGAESKATILSELWTGFSGPGETPFAFYDPFPIDLCFEIPATPEEATFYDFLDVGPQLDVRGATDLVMAKTTMFSNIWYEADVVMSDLPAGARWSVQLPGGTTWSEALRMPRAAEITSPAGFASALLPIPASEPLSITFEPFGADHVFVLFAGGNGRGKVCRLADDGAFVVPAAIVGALPSWGTAVLIAMNRTVVEHDGRHVEVLASVETIADYEKTP